jgi:hypothetical protein
MVKEVCIFGFLFLTSQGILAQNLIINGSFENPHSVNGSMNFLDSVYSLSTSVGYVIKDSSDNGYDTASDGKVYMRVLIWKVRSLYKNSDVNIKGDLLLRLNPVYKDSFSEGRITQKFILKVDVRTSSRSAYSTNKINYSFLSFPSCNSRNGIYDPRGVGNYKPLHLTDFSFFPNTWVTLMDTIIIWRGDNYSFIYLGGVPDNDTIEFKKLKGRNSPYIYMDIDNVRLEAIRN